MTIGKKQMVWLSIGAFAATLFWGLVKFSPKDEWFCRDGEWVAHGNPSNLKPETSCQEISQEKIISDVFCKKDTDCSCGSHKIKNNCFFGNRSFVNDSSQCSDFCLGASGNLRIGCVEGECRQIQ